MEFTLATLVPLIALAALGVALPIALRRLFDDTQHGVLQALSLSAVLLIVVGAGLFVLLYAREGVDLASIATRPGDSARHFLALGLKSSIVWGPLLLLTGVSMGRGVEARRSRRLAARDRD